MEFLVTCDPGLEDIAEKEIKQADNKARVEKFFNFQGKLLVDSKAEKLVKLHSLHHVIKLVKTFYLKEVSLEEIKEVLKKIEIPEMRDVNTFRVTSQRFGEHGFTSIDMQRVAGEVFLEKYKKKVDLENYDLNIRFDLVGRFGYVGLQLTEESLYKRYERAFNHTAAIKSTIAYGMIVLSSVKAREVMLDPMCGSGTIVLEAASLFKDKVKIIAGDIDERCVKGTIENARLNGLDGYIEVKKLDATRLEDYVSSIDKIITNPPYGVRMEKKNLKEFYRKFLLSSAKVLKDDGKMTMITLKANMFRHILFATKKYKIIHERVVEAGGIYPHIFVLQKI
jgi:tRNA (guanine6-N2)-methyltransferase